MQTTLNFVDGIAVGVMSYAVYLWAIGHLLAAISPSAKEARRLRKEERKWAR